MWGLLLRCCGPAQDRPLRGGFGGPAKGRRYGCGRCATTGRATPRPRLWLGSRSPAPTRGTAPATGVVLEGGVEGDIGGCQVGALDELHRFGCPRDPVHAGVFPLDRQRALVANVVERPEDALERHPTAPRRDEVPPASVVAEEEVRAEDAVAAVQQLDGLLDVDVVDAVGELVHEGRRVDELPVEVAGIEIDAEALAVADRLQGSL